MPFSNKERPFEPPRRELRLAPGWAGPVAAAAGPAPLRVSVTPAVAARPDDVRRVADAAAAAGLAAFADAHDVTVVGVALGPAAGGAAGTPTWLGLALGVPDGVGGLLLHRYEVDLAVPDVRPRLAAVLRRPATLVGHDLPPILLELWRLGLPDPARVWDVRVAAAALCLGVHHPGRAPAAGGTAAVIAGREAKEAERERATSLPTACARYGVTVAAAGPADVAASAAAVSVGQVGEAMTRDLFVHLTGVEMPWVVTTSRMTFQGARIDAGRARTVAAAAETHLRSLLGELSSAHGVRGVTDEDLEAFFTGVGLIDHFRRGGECVFDGDHLDAIKELHVAVPLIRAAKRIRTLQWTKLLAGQFVGADGRVRPRYRILGAHTGRLTCDSPNLPGIGRVFRPLVVPDDGNGIGEADWAQIEVGVAAAVLGDAALVEAFNGGDVYAAAAQRVFAAELPPDARALSPAEFRVQYPTHRDRAKVGVLGLLYGMGVDALTLRLGPEAAGFAAAFAAAYPTLHAGLAAARAAGTLRGCAATPGGLRRYRPAGGPASEWERRWFANFPVQATAATLFKVAGNRLDRLYRPLGARLVVPLHDAFVFEAPLDSLADVAELTRGVMEDVVRVAFPDLHPRVEVNVADPSCWHKAGHADSLERWAADPLHSF